MSEKSFNDRILFNADYFLRVGGERAEREVLSSLLAIRVIMYQDSYKRHKGNDEMINLDWKIYLERFLEKSNKLFDNLLELKNNDII